MAKDDTETIEKRIKAMKEIYNKLNNIIDNIPDAIPESVRNMIKDKILGDKELKELMDGIDSHRPPRLLLIGRTGVGKSSLINALCRAYVAPVSDIRSGTAEVNSYQCKDHDRILMEILDSRGIAESDSLKDNFSAEEEIKEQVKRFSPDVAIFMLNCTHRDDINSDVAFLKKIVKDYKAVHKVDLPIVTVVNKCDEAAPSWEKVPREYSDKKIKNINETVTYYKEIIYKQHLTINKIKGVSSLIGWQTQDGIQLSADDINHLSEDEKSKLEIAFDGRWQIDELFDILLDSIQDHEAQVGFQMALRLKELIQRLAKKLTNIFSGISATVALTPLPIGYIYILLVIQSILVSMIASLSGRDVSLESAKEFILSLGGVALVGFGCRIAAQQLSKLLNTLVPASGSAISSTIAYYGTKTIGDVATAYYIQGVSKEEAGKLFVSLRKQPINQNNITGLINH